MNEFSFSLMNQICLVLSVVLTLISLEALARYGSRVNRTKYRFIIVAFLLSLFVLSILQMM